MSKIQWTTVTWNPIVAYDRETGDRGWFCTRVSPGCKHCYAAKQNRQARFWGTGHDYTVPNLEEVRFELATGGQAGVFAPLRWTKPRRVFVCSMTDLFGDWVSDAWLRLLFSVMASATDHTFQVLTKRPERMAEFLYGLNWRTGLLPISPKEGPNQVLPIFCFEPDEVSGGWDVEERRPGWVPPNIWCGTSVEDQERADERIPHLLDAPAAVRFLSCEPLLGPVKLRALGCGPVFDRERAPLYDSLGGGSYWRDGDHGAAGPSLDWIIVGGESGPNARPMEIGWAQQIVEDCEQAGVAAFVKQLGSQPVSRNETPPGGGPWRRTDSGPWVGRLEDAKGGDIDEFPEDLQVREFPDELEVPA